MADYAVVDPSTGETVEEYPTISDSDLQDAIGAVDQAHRTWGQATSVEERAELVRRVGQLHKEQSKRLGEIIVREMGKPISDAMGEVSFCNAIYGYYADNAEALLADEPLDAPRRRRIGAPAPQLAGRAARDHAVELPVLPGGAVRRAEPDHREHDPAQARAAVPRVGRRDEEMFQEAGFPAGAYVNIYATNDQIEDVIADPRVRGVSLTGSERAGAAVAEIAGRHLKKVVLELGGSDPFIVLGPTTWTPWWRGPSTRGSENTGQACNAGQAVHRRRRALRDVRREVHRRDDGGEARRPEVGRHDDRPAVVRRPRPSGWRTRSSAPSKAARRSRRRWARRQLLRADGPHRHQPENACLPRGVLRPGRAGLPRRAPRKRRWSSPTTPRTASGRT